MNNSVPAQTVNRPTTPTIAFFDLDKIIPFRSRLWWFLLSVVGPWRFMMTWLTLLPTLVRLGLRKMTHAQWRDAVLQHYLKGESVEYVEKMSRRFVHRKLSAWICSDVLQSVQWHQTQGHQVVLMSDCPEVYLSILGRSLGFDRIFGVKLVVQNRHYTGSVAQPLGSIAEQIVQLDGELDGLVQHRICINGRFVSRRDVVAATACVNEPANEWALQQQS